LKPAGPTSVTDSPGQAATGPAISPIGLSRTCTWNEQVLSLPHASRATTFTRLSPTANVLPDGGGATTVTGPPQASSALISNGTGFWQTPIVMSAGQVTTGPVVSTTRMVWLAVLALPHASVAVHVRVTEYWPAQVPGVVTSFDSSLGLGSHASVADAVAKLGVAGHSIVLGSGSAAITGAVRSTTLMVWLAGLVLPHASFAVQVRVTESWPTHEPGLVTSLASSVGLGSHASVADAVAKLGVAGHSIVLGSGSAANTGAVWSTIVIDWLAVLALPHPSVAVHVRVTTDSFGQRPGAWATLNVSVTAPPQSSLAEGDENTGEAGHSTLDGSPTPEITGACGSRTLTVMAPRPAQPAVFVTSSVSVSVPLQRWPARTVTERPSAAPWMVPPVTVQWYVLMPAGPL